MAKKSKVPKKMPPWLNKAGKSGSGKSPQSQMRQKGR